MNDELADDCLNWFNGVMEELQDAGLIESWHLDTDGFQVLAIDLDPVETAEALAKVSKNTRDAWHAMVEGRLKPTQ